MFSNEKMKGLLSDIDLSNIELKNYYSVFERVSSNNEKYWVISNESDCSMCSVVSKEINLTNFEWDNNEIYIANSRDIKQVLSLSLKMFMSLKKILEENYPYQVFDLILSLSESLPSANIRFYAVRNGFRLINIENIENYKPEAILIETINM
ncbi:hypothetical protein [Brachyspira murdochii]|uniref:Uncharacterized protein n=1 Tax=Brachyspira murdochii (strain ATCC 51284 / DSM 12563 / 56-150) TaxID=526224 RepID=D5U7K2_BRAM5|nr:hypothetical protein [Brachyspira murdochii]ADG70790.1 conserved hypothetical protein [Brachyspira murdochii DSM 12563]